jgi:hypothetical protein
MSRAVYLQASDAEKEEYDALVKQMLGAEVASDLTAVGLRQPVTDTVPADLQAFFQQLAVGKAASVPVRPIDEDIDGIWDAANTDGMVCGYRVVGGCPGDESEIEQRIREVREGWSEKVRRSRYLAGHLEYYSKRSYYSDAEPAVAMPIMHDYRWDYLNRDRELKDWEAERFWDNEYWNQTD